MSLKLATDFNDFTSNLVCVQETLLKLKRENRHIGSRVFLAQRDKESLNALKIRVQESRNTFEVGFLSSLLTQFIDFDLTAYSGKPPTLN